MIDKQHVGAKETRESCEGNLLVNLGSVEQLQIEWAVRSTLTMAP